MHSQTKVTKITLNAQGGPIKFDGWTHKFLMDVPIKMFQLPVEFFISYFCICVLHQKNQFFFPHPETFKTEMD
jgi:hypothetical protein